MMKNKFFRYGLTLLIILAVAAATYYVYRTHWCSITGNCPGESPRHRLQGADISHWNGPIDWIELKKSGISFLYMKATQGSSFTDPMFQENWTSALNYGFYRGAYHYFMPNEDPKVQADFFLSVAHLSKGDLLPVVDVEVSEGVTPEELANNLEIFVNTINEALGRYPIIYTDKGFWDQNMTRDFSQCPLWIASWNIKKDPPLPNGWNDWVFWQYIAKASLNSIPESKGQTDLDYFHSDKLQLKSYLIK